MTDAADARFVPTGHLIYFRRGQLFAAPFDPARPQRIGSERALLSNVMQATNGVNSYFNSGAAQLALSSSSGTLAYLSGGEFPDVNRLIVWVDRQGKVEQFHVPAKPYYLPRLSPDDQQVAVQTLQSERRVWVHDLRRPDSLTPVTALELEAYHHIWSRDGTRLAFCASPNGRYGLFWARGDGTQPAGERLNASDSWLATASWADDDKLLYVRYDAKTRFDVWMLSRDDDNWSSHVLLNAEGDEQDARVSPNGRWLAYSRSETGMGREISYVYVRRFPEPTGQRQVGEGSEPVWARDGKELFYIRRSAATFELVAHNVAPDGTVAPAGRALFDLTSRRLTRYYPVPGYDVTRDGRRFVFAQNPDTPVPSPTDRIDVILNWFEELKAKALVK